MSWRWQLKAGQCIGCGICADVCVPHAVTLTREMTGPIATVEKCNGCRTCARECPTGAIEVEELSLSV